MYVNPTELIQIQAEYMFDTFRQLKDDNGNFIFSNEDLVELHDDNENLIGWTIYITTTEQFVKIMQYEIQVPYKSDSEDYHVYIKFKNNLYFQNDIKYREGFINGFLFRNLGYGTIYYQADDNLDEVILQGIQITGEYFFKALASYSYMNFPKLCFHFKNLYFKDCVFTKTKKDKNRDILPFASLADYDREGMFLFEDCKLSMHIRAGEYGYRFDTNQGWSWKNCSRYIEYSDINLEEVPYEEENGDYGSMYGTGYFWAPTTNCATIVRNMASKIKSGHEKHFTHDTVNSSWDIEIYKLLYEIDQAGSFDSGNALKFGLNNCFLSVKVDEKSNYPSSDTTPLPNNQISWRENEVIGVNIFNKGDVGQQNATVALSNANVAQLTDTECHDVNKLNQYGFFVNRAYTFTLLTSKPSNWDTDYNTYYIKVGRAYTINNSDVWAENTYYQKVYL